MGVKGCAIVGSGIFISDSMMKKWTYYELID